jgi:hypothetical protein
MRSPHEMRTLLLVLFTVAWAAVAFAVIRSLVIAWGINRRLAGTAAFAVAGAFALGATVPFSLWRLPPPGGVVSASPETTSVRTAQCPAGAKVNAKAGAGHIDVITVSGVQHDIAKPITLSPNDPIRIGGWAVASGGPATGLCVLVDRHPVSAGGLYGVERADVATAMSNPADHASGFDLSLRVRPGDHVLTVAPVQADGALTPLPQTVIIRVH